MRTEGGGWKGNKGGEMTVDAPGQHVLERTSCSISSQVCPRTNLLARHHNGSVLPALQAARYSLSMNPSCTV